MVLKKSFEVRNGLGVGHAQAIFGQPLPLAKGAPMEIMTADDEELIVNQCVLGMDGTGKRANLYPVAQTARCDFGL